MCCSDSEPSVSDGEYSSPAPVAVKAVRVSKLKQAAAFKPQTQLPAPGESSACLSADATSAVCFGKQLHSLFSKHYHEDMHTCRDPPEAAADLPQVMGPR